MLCGWKGGRRGEADVGFAIPPKTQLIYVSGRAVEISTVVTKLITCQNINWQIFISASTGKIYGDGVTVLLETSTFVRFITQGTGIKFTDSRKCSQRTIQNLLRVSTLFSPFVSTHTD